MNIIKESKRIDITRMSLFLLLTFTITLESMINIWAGVILFISFTLLLFYYKIKNKQMRESYASLLKIKEEHLALLSSQVLGITPKEFIGSLNESPAGQAILTKDLKFVFANYAFCNIFNLTDKKYTQAFTLNDISFFEVFPYLESTNRKFSKALTNCISQRIPFTDKHVCFQDEKSYEYYCDWSITPINGNKVLVTVVDRTQEHITFLRTKNKKEQYGRMLTTILADPDAAAKQYTKELISELTRENS